MKLLPRNLSPQYVRKECLGGRPKPWLIKTAKHSQWRKLLKKKAFPFLYTYDYYLALPYDNIACTQAYAELLTDPDNPDRVTKAWELSMPVLGCVLKSKFKWLQPGMEAYDEAVSSVAIKLYNVLSSKKFRERYYIDIKTHFSLLFGICRLEAITALNKVRKYHADLPVFITQSNLDSSPGSIHYKLYLNDLPNLILQTVASNCRFTGERKDLCLFIAEQLIEGTGIPVVTIRKKWGTKDLPFFIDYSRALVREALLEHKEDFRSMKPTEDSALDDAVMTSIYDIFGEGLRAETVMEWGATEDPEVTV